MRSGAQSPPCPSERRLVTLLAAQPALDYERVGSVMQMALGSTARSGCAG
jgi:hypothetical protein